MFRVNTTEVEVQVKPGSNGQQFTFMRFVFRSPLIELSAPVLDNQKFALKLLREGNPCVLLGRAAQLFKSPSTTPTSLVVARQPPPRPVPEPQTLITNPPQMRFQLQQLPPSPGVRQPYPQPVILQKHPAEPEAVKFPSNQPQQMARFSAKH